MCVFLIRGLLCFATLLSVALPPASRQASAGAWRLIGLSASVVVGVLFRGRGLLGVPNVSASVGVGVSGRIDHLLRSSLTVFSIYKWKLGKILDRNSKRI